MRVVVPHDRENVALYTVRAPIAIKPPTPTVKPAVQDSTAIVIIDAAMTRAPTYIIGRRPHLSITRAAMIVNTTETTPKPIVFSSDALSLKPIFFRINGAKGTE